MKIVINAVGWSNLIKGMDRYIIELIRHLSIIDDKNKYYIFYGRWQEYFHKLVNKKNFRLICIHWSPNRIIRHLWHALIFPIWAYNLKPDIVHIPGTMPLLFKIGKTVVTIHDELLEFYFTPKYGLFRSLARKIIVRMETKKCTKIIAVSPAVKEALIKILNIRPSKIQVILNGVHIGQFNPKLRGQAPFGINKPYILFVGVSDKNKNLGTLIKAYHLLNNHLKAKYLLVIAGKKGNDWGNIQKLIQMLGLENSVIFLGHLTEKLPELYANAEIFVMPSYYEGFSLPVLEAMASGVPVIVSNNIAIADFIKQSAICFNPHNILELKNIIESLLDKEVAQKLAREGRKLVQSFSWLETAKSTLDVYNQVSVSTHT